jgi:hypothetical protein
MWESQNSKLPKGIILGSSTAYRNINTDALMKKTSINWFNLASSSQTPEISSLIIRRIVKDTNIKFVILDIYGELSNVNSYESIFDLINNSRFNIKDKLNLLLIDPNPKLMDIIIYRKIEEMTSGRLLRTPSGHNGIYLKNGSTYSNQKKNKFPQHDLKFKLLEINNNESIKEIIKYCSEKDIKLIINIAPILFTNQYSKIDYPYIIFNDELNIANKLFYDSHHMIGEGSIQYSKILGNKINQIISSKSNYNHQGSN